MKIAVDLDDTLGDFASSFIKFVNEKLKTNYAYSDINNYYEELFSLSREETRSLLKEFSRSKSSIQPFEEAFEALDTLRENHELVIVTSRPDLISESTRKWVDNHFRGFFSDIHHAVIIDGGNQVYHKKSRICKKIGADVLIDDNLNHNLSCAEEKIRSILLDKPWNQHDDLPSTVKRVFSWKEVLDEIKKIERELEN